MAFWDLICEEIIGVDVLLVYIGTGVVWGLASYLMRREYLQLGRHSNILMMIWIGMMAYQVANLFIILGYDMKEDFFMNTKIHNLLLLSMYGILVAVGYYQPIDSVYTRRPSEDKYYQSMKDISKSQAQIDEDVWSKLNEVAYYSDLERKQEEEKKQSIREKIQNIVVENYDVKENDTKTVVVSITQYYVIKIYRGKKGTIVSETRRRYREFYNLYNEVIITADSQRISKN